LPSFQDSPFQNRHSGGIFKMIR